MKRHNVFNVKSAVLMTSLFASTACFSADDETGEVFFRANVESQCGIEVEENTGTLGFGDYGQDAAKIKIVNNSHDGQVILQLTDLDYDNNDFLATMTNEQFYFKVSGKTEKEGSADTWFIGQTFDHDDLGGGQKLDIRAKVSLDESDAVAKNDIVLETQWTAFCIS
ncbi:hypothetical protein ACE1OE_17040 [Vibrio sp. E150_011]